MTAPHTVQENLFDPSKRSPEFNAIRKTLPESVTSGKAKTSQINLNHDFTQQNPGQIKLFVPRMASAASSETQISQKD